MVSYLYGYTFYKNCITVLFLNVTNVLNMQIMHIILPLLNQQKVVSLINTHKTAV